MKHLIIQELQPVKETIKFKLLKDKYRDMYQVIDDMAALTASTQIRSGRMQGSGTIDELMAFGNDQGWQQEVINYAEEYALQVKRYFRQFKTDFRRGMFDNS
jgi:hypothetical protein